MKQKGNALRNLAAVLIPILLITGLGLVYIYQAQKTKPKIGVINLTGSIQGFEYANLAEKARDDPEIKAVVIRFNSPGGSVTGTFQAETSVSKLASEKPVIANLEEVAASGAYVVASATDHIYAYRNTTTAGLGVIAMWVSYADYYENLGIDYYIWKTGNQKDMFAPWRKPTENEKEYLQNLVEDFESQLYDIITTNRPETSSSIENVKDGSTVYGSKALELDLIDEFGRYQNAVDRAAENAGLKEGEYKTVNLSNYFNN